MIITPDFVFIFFPKTGSTFTRYALRQLFEKTGYSYSIHSVPTLESKYIANPKKKITEDHGRVEQIPLNIPEPIVSIIRNPFEILVSHYLFRAWERQSESFQTDLLLKKYPNFPDISFTEFVYLINDWKISLVRPDRIPVSLGKLSHLFIQYYFFDPDATILNFTESFLLQKRWVNHIPRVKFLRMENLENDLRLFLIDKGFSKKDVEFIKCMEKKNISSNRKGGYRYYFNGELTDYVMYRERLLFDIFPDYAPNL